MSYIKVPLKNVFNVERIVSIFELDATEDYLFTGESHNFWELRYVAEGEIDTHYGKKLCHMNEGDIFFHAPDEFHDIICDGVHPAKIIIASFECHSAAMKYFIEKKIHIPEEMRFLVFEMLKTAKQCFTNCSASLTIDPGAPFGAEQLLRGEIESFLIRLVQLEEHSESKSFFTTREDMLDKLISDIISYLDDHLYGNVSLDDIAEHFHFGKSHICHVFKEKCKTSIIQYFIKMKLDEAAKLLRNEGTAINEISDSLGFDSPQYFAKLFKRENGMTPTAYRISKQKRTD